MMNEIRVFHFSIILLSSVGKNAASIQGRLLFFVFTKFVRLLIKGGFYSRAASIQGRLLFKKIRYISLSKGSCATASLVAAKDNKSKKNTKKDISKCMIQAEFLKPKNLGLNHSKFQSKI